MSFFVKAQVPSGPKSLSHHEFRDIEGLESAESLATSIFKAYPKAKVIEIWNFGHGTYHREHFFHFFQFDNFKYRFNDTSEMLQFFDPETNQWENETEYCTEHFVSLYNSRFSSHGPAEAMFRAFKGA